MTKEEPPVLDTRLYRTLARLIFLGAAVYLTIRFLDAILFVLLLFILSAILVIALNPAVVWFEARGVPRALGTLLLFAGGVALLALFGWLAVPRLVGQGAEFVEQLPAFLDNLQQRAGGLLADYPVVEESLIGNEARAVEQLTMWLQNLLMRAGRYSLSLASAVAMSALVLIIVAYTLAHPRPLLEGLLGALPVHLRDRAERAFVRGSDAVTGWLLSDIIVGAIQAVAATIVLTLLGVPGAFIWGSLAFFSELVPSIGVYIMSIPPIIVAFAVDPMLGLWTAIFYIAMAQVTSYFLVPMIRSSTMDMHPVTLLFAVLALGSLYGLIGALIATPLAGMLKAFYEEFYLAQQPADPRLDERVENIIKRNTGPPPIDGNEASETNEEA